MEQWNSGMMGSGMMQCWINGPATGVIEDKIKMVNILISLQIRIFAKRHFEIFLKFA